LALNPTTKVLTLTLLSRRWSVEEAFTECKRQDRPIMELLYEKQCMDTMVKRLHTELAEAEERAAKEAMDRKKVEL